MYKSKRQKNKSFDWYGLSQRFSIRKYHFGAASVLLGTALILGAAQTTAKAEEATTENKTEAVTPTSKDAEAAATPANVTLPATEATTGAPVLDKKELSEEEIAKLAAEVSKKDEKASETATAEKREVSDKEKATLTAPSTDKKVDKTVDEKADKKDEKKAENPITATKKILEQLTSEAEVLNTTAANYAEKKVEDKSSKEAIAAAVAAAKVEITASKKVLNEKDVTAEQLNLQLQRISTAIEAVYTEMKRAGHIGKVEAVLPGETATAVNINTPINKVTVNNLGSLTDEEVRAIEKEIRTANPDLKPEDKIEVTAEGAVNRTVAKVILANGRVDQAGNTEHGFLIGDVAFGTAGEKNYDQLREGINWFDFARAKITYADGTKVGEIEYVDNAPTVTFTSSKGRKERGRFTMVRTVLESSSHPELVGKKTNSAEFLASGIGKYTLWKDQGMVESEVKQNTSQGKNRNEVYEALQEGMRFEVPTKVKGYVLTATVSSLSRKKVQNEVAKLNNADGEPANINRSKVGDQVVREDVILTRQDTGYSHLRLAGFPTQYTDSTGRVREGLTAFASAYDGGNVGVKFQVSATYNGRPVAVNAIAADAEDLSAAEFTQFETDGTPWQEFMRVNKNKANSQGLKPNKNIDGNFKDAKNRVTGKFELLGYDFSEWNNKTENGYGSQLFGPFVSGVNSKYDLPIGLTQDVKNLGVYINSSGNQSASIGFVVYDGGDAPASYGSAQHVIGNFNKEKNGQQVTATQPYLGDTPADSDFRTVEKEKSAAWVLDDVVYSETYKEISLTSGTTQVTNQKGQTGTYYLDGRNPVIRLADGSQVAIKAGEILKTLNTTADGDGLPVSGIYNIATGGVGIGNLPDEGENQLLDPTVATRYTLKTASDTQYVFKGVRINRGLNNDVAYARGWVDFNSNGKFDQYEASEIITVNKDGTYDFVFNNIPQLLNTSVDNVGVRLRVALDKGDLNLPTGVAGSGEVEDFQTHVIHPPRGTRNVSSGLQGKPQKIEVSTTDFFKANGKTEVSDYGNWNQIEKTIAPKFVLTSSMVARETATGNQTHVTDPKGNTVYLGEEVTLYDARGNELGTGVKVTNPMNKQTEYYLSKYTEYDNAGNKVGVYELNKDNNGDYIKSQTGVSKTTIDFTPELGYVGTAKGVAIRAWDENRISTGWYANDQTIKESRESLTLADKDKILDSVNKNVNNTTSMDSTYIPTVIDIKPVGKDETTIDSQGKTQSATPKIPEYGTVESITETKIAETSIPKEHVLINKKEPVTFAHEKNIPGKIYTEDTKVTEETELTYEDGGTATFKPVDKIPASTIIAEKSRVEITGSGNVEVSNVRIVKGTFSSNLVPAGSVLEGASPIAPKPITVIRNGVEVTVNTGEKIQKGDQLVTPLPIEGGAQHTIWKVTFQKGDYIPQATGGYNPKLVSETSVDKIIGTKGDSLTLNGNTYVNNNDTIPKGTRTAGKSIDLLTMTLPKATHVDPQTGKVTTVDRRYTKVTDTEIVIENEGTYTLVPKTTTNEKGETVYEDATVVFTPHPSFVGVGTGVTLKQPDLDYPTVANPDSVTRRYGIDYGHAAYTPTVTPNLTVTITRKIHYVYEGDTSTAAKDKTPILTIDGKPVINEQTLTYNRDYVIMSEDDQTEKDITVATEMTLERPITVDRYVRKSTGEVVKEPTQVTVLKPGDVVKAGTELPAGTVIVGAWKSINPENDHFTNIISPTLKGYTAEVQLPENEYTKSEKDGVQSHVRSSNQTPVGVYTPTIKDGKVNSQDVGSYEPMVSAVRADNKDDFDVYVYYKADKQVARVVYIDMDAANNANQGVLETHTGSDKEANKSTTDTITKDETLIGDSATRIKYSTAATIAKYEAMGYELKRDGFTNDDDGNRIVGGRKFDEESVADSENAGEKPQNQTFYVFLGHKRDTGAKTETADVTRTINYKYKDGGAKAAESVTETLNFKRNITIDMALVAAAFPEDTATFNAENTKATPEEKKAAQDKYDEVVAKYNAAAEKAKEDPTTSEALKAADKNVIATEKTLADAKKANNSLVITSESTQAQRDAKAATEAALQAAQEAYNNALTARDTARTNYLAADNSALAKAVITTQQALEAENAKVAAAKAEYEAKVKDNNASDADKEAALTKFTDALAVAKTAAANATAAKTAFTEAKDEEETLNDAKVAEAVKNKAVQDRENTTKVAKDAARQAYYDAIIAKVKEEAKKETPDKNKVAAVSFGEWKALGSTATNLPANEQLSDAEKQSDNAFNHVTSPTIAGYLADKVAIDKTDAIDPLADDYSVDVFYEKGEQRATVKFVEVDANNPDTVITPGVAEDLVEIGKTGDNFATLNTAAVKAAIKKLQDKGYTLVSDGFENPGTGVSNTTFDNDPKNDQEFVVKVKATVVEIPSFDPTKPVSNENPKPTPGVTPIDPNNPTGPKWTEDLIKAVKVQEEVTRTIKYVYEDGTEVPAEKLTDVADKKVKTLKFTRPGKINVVTGEITYGDWSADQTFDAVTSPTIENYTAAVAGVTPTTANVPAKTVSATDKDFEEVVVYKTKVITVDPNSPNYTEPKKDQPIDPTDPNSPKWTDELLAKLKNKEEVTRTVSYVYSNDTNKLNQAEKDGNKAGANVVKDNTEVTPFVTKVNFTRVAKVNPVTNEITYEDWKPTTPAGATAPDDTLEGNTTVPVIPGYVATGDVVSSKTDVTSVKAEDKDITEKVVYEALGKYVPVVPEGFTPPTIENPQYPNNDTDPTKPGDPTTRTTIPYVPGTTPVGPDGQPLTPKNGDKTQGYLPPTPTTPTGDTTITYVKDGTQIAVTHFIEVNSATDKTEKGAVATSIVDTGDTGKAFTKGQSVTDTINALKAKGYTVVDNGYPTDGTFDADATTNQEYKVLVTVKPVTITPNTDVPNPEDPNTPADNPIQPGKPIDPNNPDGPKWTKDLIDKLKDAREETVTRTITYKYSDVTSELKAEDAAKAGQKAADTVTNTVTFKRPVTIDPVTKEFTYGDWEATNGTTLEGKAELPKVDGYIATGDVDSSKKDVENVTATDNDITENVVYKAVGKYVPVIPDGITPPANTNVDPKPYTNDPQDGSKVKDPDPTNPVVPGTTTPIVPQVPGTTPVGPDGKPLKPVDSSDLSKGYVPPTPTDPMKDTSIIYVKDGSQVAVVHFVDEKGNSVNESVIETGDTGGTISATKVDAVKAALVAKGYEVVDPADTTLYTADKEGFYKEADRKFDAVSDKATGATDEKVPSQQYYVIVKAKELPVVPTKPVDKNDKPVDPTDPTTPNKPRDPETTVTPKPTDPVPNDPKGRTYGELGLVEQVTRTIDYVYDNGTKVEEDKLGTAKDERTKTLTFTRNAKINAVTGEVTYLDANGNATTKEAAPWTPATTDTFNTVNSPVIDTYVLLDSNQKTITGETVVATDKDIAHKVVYKKAGSIKPQIPAGVNPLTPATDTPYPNNPQDPSGVLKPDPTKPTDPTQPNGPTTPVIPEVPGYTPYGPNGKPLEKDPNGGYKVPDLPTDPTQDTPIVYVKNGSQLAITKFVDVDGNGLAPSVVDSGDEGTNFTKDGDVTATINAILARGYEKVENKNNEKPYPTEATDKVFDKDSATNQEFTVTFKAKELPVVPTKPVNPNNEPVDPTDPTNPNKPRDPETSVTPKPEDKVPNDPKGRTYGELGLVEEVTRTINYVKNDGSKAADTVKETLTFTRKAKINAVTGEVTYLDNDGNATTKEAAPWTPVNGDKFAEKVSPSVTNYTPTVEKVAEKTGVTATDEDIVETVVYNPSTTNVDPNPVTPGENPDPNKVVENDPKKRTLKELGLIEEVTHTVHYKLEDGSDAGIADNVQKVTFTRTAKIDSVTGAILEYGKWTPETKEFTAVTTPAKDGYIASAKTSTANANVGATDKDTEETIIYRKLGSYVPVVPAGVTPPADFDKTPKPYPNATPEDPTKPGTPTTTTIPEIPGTTPVGPDGTPLTKNPNGGYDLPPVPKDPTQNTTITYVKDGSQVAVVHFIEVNSETDKTEKGAVAKSIVDTGDTGKAFTKGQSVTDTINALKAKGYTVVENGYPENGTFDADATTNQEYKVLVTVKEIPVSPDNETPTPNTPIDPQNPDGPKWTPELIKELENGLQEDVKRTIKYIYSDGTEVPADKLTDVADKKEKTLTFKRSATINPVTGKITFGNWTPDKQSFEEVTSPAIDGYIVDRATVPAKEVTETAGDITEVVVYKKLGSYVPVVPEGVTVPPGTDTTPKVYPKDPTDPTRPGTPTTVIPHIPGVTPLNPSTGKPLEPVTPGRPEDGYKVPPVPTDPTQDTNIVYAKDGSQVAIVHFVDEDGNAVHTSFAEAGDVGSKFTKAGEVAKIVTELEKSGYSVVPNKAGQAEYPGKDGEFDSVDDKGENGVSQVYYVTVAKPVPVTPTDPKNPNEDPKNPNPGDPIDPNKPDGPKWTEDALNKLNNIKTVTRTITYVKAGTDEEVSSTEAPKVTDKVNFKRTAIVNPKDGSLVGYDTNGDGKADVPATDTDSGWTAVNNDTTFDKVTSPVVKGYVLKNTAQKEVAETTGLTPKSDNETIKVEYVPVGTWTPKVPEGETPINPIPYPNDPKDPGKVVDPNDPINPNDPNKPSVPVIPHIPGTTPKDPNGNPLKPVDPTDPSKGYVPPTPTTPTENTEINYEKDTQKAVTKFVDPSGNPIPGVTNIEETGKSGEPLTKATEVTTEIAKLIAKGYDLVSNNYGKDNNGNFDKDSGKDQEYTVVLIPHVEPIKPFDPTNPDDPNTPKPGQPIDPNNPDGPKWTEELINKLETTKHVTRNITYVEDGTDKEVADKATDKVTFTREAKINVVTGTIEYGKWTPVNNDTTFDKVTSPVVPGYVLKDPSQKEVDETTGLTENSKDENIKVVYVPVGRLVPKVPDGVTPPTPTPYDNDPQDPGKVVPPSPTKPTDPTDPNSPKVPVIPHIPGTTPKVPQDPTKPVDPNTNPLVPLKPVDPKDPSKGYEVPPVPTNPSTDTPIVYENDKQKAITNFVDNNGKVVSDPVVDYGESGSKFTKSGDVENKIKELVKKGYIVTSNDYPSADTDRVFDKDKDKDQIFNVKVTPLIVPTDPNSPDKPQVPTDPTKPVGPNNPLKPVTPSNPEPGKPVFPEDPNSPVWPDTVKDLVTESSATRTITYVDHNGKEVAATHTETIKFKRTAKVNLVTGDITYGEWTVVGNDTILDGNKLPKVDGYIARGGDIESSQKDIKATAGVNITERVVYDKLGSWIPKLPEGQTQVPPTPYPNDPTDPTKPGTDKPRVPYVPGFIPVDPNGNPLKPVDPNDPTKGYEVPVVPADPTQDTPIKYIPVPKPNNGGGNNGGGGGNTPTPQPQPNPTPQPEPSPAPNPVPVTPETPEQPVVPVAPEQPAEPATPQYMDGQRELPNTGTEAHSSLAALGLLGALSGFGLIARKKRKDEE
ncbi:CshA/CshB family fibrillar adhesin-related protein [Streptococcus sp. 27098_8_103]|uniref:mucin-binding protein n=1 Tax=Streptococcus sp. 27098_8_103 TaxID=3003660 RepID=UPI00352C1CEB